MNARYNFYSKPEYYQKLIDEISKAKSGDRAALASMGLKLQEPHVSEIIQQLTKAASRGVNVQLWIDARSFLLWPESMRPGPLFYRGHLPKKLKEPFKSQLLSLDALKSAGGHYAIVNQPARRLSLPFAGRSHLKLAVINDYLMLGGCNLTSADEMDMMVGWRDIVAADLLYELTAKVVANKKVRAAIGDKDILHKLGPRTELLIDSGVPKQSAIFDRALRLIDEAEQSVFIVCQYYPNSVTLAHLKAAYRRGVKVTMVYNHPSQHGFLRSGLQNMVILRERMRTPNRLFQGQLQKDLPFLHAKLVATEQAAIIGSHNFVPAGVNLGTAEIALLDRSPDFSKACVDAITAQLNF
ncbi:MAG TPA: phospholipase D-like domain-containing protein [Candidatus Binatia bacterium]|nr:phospholipase D-like domain-containing protein [Candidatus Binatia bacterium]